MIICFVSVKISTVIKVLSLARRDPVRVARVRDDVYGGDRGNLGGDFAAAVCVWAAR